MHHHRGSTDCCKTMPSMRASLAQPSVAHGGEIPDFAYESIPTASAPGDLQSSFGAFFWNAHGPPGSFPPAVFSLSVSLRI
jgi:hypothetical protein